MVEVIAIMQTSSDSPKVQVQQKRVEMIQIQTQVQFIDKFVIVLVEMDGQVNCRSLCKTVEDRVVVVPENTAGKRKRETLTERKEEGSNLRSVRSATALARPKARAEVLSDPPWPSFSAEPRRCACCLLSRDLRLP